MDNASSNFPNSANSAVQGSPWTFYKDLYWWYSTRTMFTMWPLWLFPPCQTKALCRSAKDLNHLSSDASSCYLDNCQQEQAFPFYVTVCSGTIMFLINNFTHLAAARGCQDANNIYRLLCGAIQGRLSVSDCPDRSWQHPEPEIPANRLSKVSSSKGGRVRSRPWTGLNNKDRVLEPEKQPYLSHYLCTHWPSERYNSYA